MKLDKQINKGDKFITIHYWDTIGIIGVYGWKKKPTGKDNLMVHKIGETIEL